MSKPIINSKRMYLNLVSTKVGEAHTPILATKLYIPPPRPSLVPRPRLIDRLNQGLAMGCKLTLISASAGFGKTTLVSEWIAALTSSLSH